MGKKMQKQNVQSRRNVRESRIIMSERIISEDIFLMKIMLIGQYGLSRVLMNTNHSSVRTRAKPENKTDVENELMNEAISCYVQQLVSHSFFYLGLLNIIGLIE